MIDLPDTASPLYEKVKDYILTNIGTGRWGKDRKLPSEMSWWFRLVCRG